MSKLFNFCLLSPFILIIFHILIVRIILLLEISISNQKIVIYSILISNVVLIFVLNAIKFITSQDLFLYIFLYFNLIAYSYFHFFNMSETARRIRLLVMIKNKKVKNIKDIENFYSSEHMYDVRMKRLFELNQIEIVGDKIFLKNRVLYFCSCCVLWSRYLLGFEK